MKMTPVVKKDPKRAAQVVTKALFRAAEPLELSQKELADILGLSAATISRMAHGKLLLAVEAKEWEVALYFLRMCRSMLLLFGGHTDKCKNWFDAHNFYLEGTPRELIKDIGGLQDVCDYLDAMRGNF